MEDKLTRLLVVDDDRALRDIIRMFFSRKGFEIEEASNGVEGIARFKEFHPHIILTDLSMPVMDGEEMIRQIRKSNTKGSFIVMTAGGDQIADPEAHAEAMGVDAVLLKPLIMKMVHHAYECVCG